MEYRKYFAIIIATIIACPLTISSHAEERSYIPGEIYNEQYGLNETVRTFKQADPAIIALALKIERHETITMQDIKALPEGALNARYNFSKTLLFFALNCFNAQAVDILLQSGADPYMTEYDSNLRSLDFTTYLAMITIPDEPQLSRKFQAELTKKFLKNGGDPNHVLGGNNKFSILYFAAYHDNDDMIKILIDAGANPLYIDTEYHSTIRSIIENNWPYFIDLVCHGFYTFAKA